MKCENFNFRNNNTGMCVVCQVYVKNPVCETCQVETFRKIKHN